MIVILHTNHAFLICNINAFNIACSRTFTTSSLRKGSTTLRSLFIQAIEGHHHLMQGSPSAGSERSEPSPAPSQTEVRIPNIVGPS